jgi:lipopolysaccharide biosynthesis regulator YciM
MSQTPTISQPPEPTPASSRPPSSNDGLGVPDHAVRRLRAELSATQDRQRQSRLLSEIADLEERAGDEPAAARDYLAAYNADPSFREPLEGLVRLLEKRRSLKNLGKLVDALVRAAVSPDEKVRALLMRAAYRVDVTGEMTEAATSAREATQIEGAATAELAAAWLSLEVLAGRMGDAATRAEALSRRVTFASQPTWRALLLIDRARLAAKAGEVDAAVALLGEARALQSEATWAAVLELERIAHHYAGLPGTDEARARARVHAEALNAQAEMLEVASDDPARGDALGVPQWMREPARRVDAWLRAAEARRGVGDVARAGAILDRALALVGTMAPGEAELADAAVANARVRVAEQTGDTALAATLAARRLDSEKHGGLAAALAMRVAEQAAAEGDATRALDALARAIVSDSGCLPARALQLDALADAPDKGAFAAQLESFADHLATDEARGRAFVLAAYVWAVHANDVPGAKAALSQATMYGIAPPTTGRLARTLAAVAGDAGWYEDATRRLLAGGGQEDALSLSVELVRSRQARSDAEGVSRALKDMAAAPQGAWIARALEAFLPATRAEPRGAPAEDGDQAPPSSSDDGDTIAGTFTDAETTADGAPDTSRESVEIVLTTPRSAPTLRPAPRPPGPVEELAALEGDVALARGLTVVAALRSVDAGDVTTARERLRELAEKDPSDMLVGSFLADLDRSSGDHAAAARTVSAAASAAADAELTATLRLEAGFERWRAGDKKAALADFEAARENAPEAAGMVLAWASRGGEADDLEGRRRALARVEAVGTEDPRALALERFASEVLGGDATAATGALGSIALDRPASSSSGGDLNTAAALAHLVWSNGDTEVTRNALSRLGERGEGALRLAAAEEARIAREAGDADRIAQAAGRWFEAGGGLPAALEWLAGATAGSGPTEEKRARLAVAASLSGDAREAVLASAAMLEPRIAPDRAAPLVVGASVASRLANLELAPPSSDPRRRFTVLMDLGGALGDDAGLDAASLAGWSALACSDYDGARACFEKTVGARPGDLAAWEGLRACGEQSGDRALRARAASELGTRCADAARAAAFWEEAALLWMALGDEEAADRALDASFERDRNRPVAFDKLFRRVRDRKDNEKLLAVTAQRLEVTDDPKEIQKLYWEQARVLREKGNQDAALEALEHVTMLDPDHVGALALLGEINIRRGNFEAAAESLARLAKLEVAPPKNRVTAGVAAVDLYENKLDRYDKALEVLLALHQARLSTLPVRERLARAAARTGAWREATAILEELMYERPEAEGRIEAARLAMAIHRDRLSEPTAAHAATVKLLDESPTDGEAIDMLLTIEVPREVRERLMSNARKGLVEAIEARPLDVPNVRRLVKVSRSLVDDALQQAALGALVALGGGDAPSEQALAQLGAKKTRVPQMAITEGQLRWLLAPGDDGPVADLFVMLGSTLAEALGPTLQACGIAKRDKVDPRSGLALRTEISAWAGAFGIRELDLYVGGKDPLGVQGVPGEPPSLVVGAGVSTPLAPAMRARIARELFAIVRGTTVLRWRDDMTVAAIVVSACHLAEVSIEHPPYAVLAEVERLLAKAIARRTRKAIADACRAIVRTGADARAWSARALASQDRMAAVASGDVSLVLGELLGVPAERLGQAVKGSARAEELLRFVLSPHYLELRRSLGLEASA